MDTLTKATDPNFSNDPAAELSAGLRLRAAGWADLEPVARLILEVCTADGDPTVAASSADLAREWQTPGFSVERDAWVVETGDGRLVGYQEFVDRHGHASLTGDGYVHPGFHGRGIGTAMLRALDARARREPDQAASDLRVYLRNGMIAADEAARRLHENEGYAPIRYSWRMEINLTQAPPAPNWPEGVALRPFDPESDDRLVWQAETEAFRDHWGSLPVEFEIWKFRKLAREDFEPSLWFIAWEGGEIAGFSECRFRMGIGWVGTLGVRRAWRKRGLGLALLLHSFGEFHRRGMNTIALGVDAENPTGATRLYKKAGMRVANEYVFYEKEFRPGREPQDPE
jgi:mycothiol synthase